MDRFITNYENITLWQMARASFPKVAKFVVKENYKHHKSVRDIMIKKLVYSIIFAGLLLGLSTTSLFAQNQQKDEIHLKNGSIIKGSIVEEIPTQSITIETADGSRFVIKSEEVKRINRKQDTPTKTKRIKGSYYGISALMSTNFEGVGFGGSPVDLNILLGDSGFGLAGNFGIAYYENVLLLLNFGVGPSFTFMASPSIALTTRSSLGFGKLHVKKDNVISISSNLYFDWSLGVHARFFANKRWNLLTGIEYENAPALNYNTMILKLGVSVAL